MNFYLKLKKFFSEISFASKKNLTEKIEFELKELKNLFSLLIFNAYIGYPDPSIFVNLELLPYLEKDLIIMLKSTLKTKDMLSDLASTFDGF